jgi:hypothetical protein
MPSICLGSSDEDVDCDCAVFVSRRSGRSGCKRCGHDQASHSDSTATGSREHPTIAATQRDRDKYVDRMVRSLATSAVHDKARRETLQGFRPTPTASVSPPIAHPFRYQLTPHICAPSAMFHPPRGRRSPGRPPARSLSRARRRMQLSLVELYFSHVETRYVKHLSKPLVYTVSDGATARAFSDSHSPPSTPQCWNHGLPLA